MNLLDTQFLCLDIGTSCVRGIAHRIQSGNITNSATAICESLDTIFAIKTVVNELEHTLGRHFDSAYITGNFGQSEFNIYQKHTKWNGEHKISVPDIQAQLSQINIPDGFYPMHIIPLVYNTPRARDIKSPIGHTDYELISAFGAIMYDQTRKDEILATLHRCHIQAISFFDPHFVQNSILNKDKKTTLFLDMGAQFTTASIWTNRGCVWHIKIKEAMSDITSEIAQNLNIDFEEAERIKRNVANLIPQENDHFTPADSAYDFSRSDVNDILIPMVVNIIGRIKELSIGAIEKYKPTQIILTGGGSEIEGTLDFFENAFGLPGQNLHPDATINSLSNYIWKAEEDHCKIFDMRQKRLKSISAKITKLFSRKPKKQKQKFIPILPSTLCFNMQRPETYNLFNTNGISMIHVDIMDGLYVNKIAGSIAELKTIRSHTRAHLHVHLMTESPSIWAKDVINAGADTVIISTNTSGVKNALREIKVSGHRCGIALNPESDVSILKPILRDIDEVMVMAVKPGAAGQQFNPDVLRKISVLAATRKKYGLKFLISVDGGINDKTAQMCWHAGADLLVSGSYLARSNDFSDAIQSMLKKS